MAIASVRRVTSDLPYAIREPIRGYTVAVESSLGQIQADAGVYLSEAEQEQLLLIAALRKLRAVCAANYWAIDNAAYLLARSGTEAIRIGATSYSRGSELHTLLGAMLTDLENTLIDLGLPEDLLDQPYDQIAQWIAGGRSTG